MLFSRGDLARIAGRASTLAERQAGLCVPEDSEFDYQANPHLKAWREMIEAGGEKYFAKRLSWDGLEINSIARILGSVRWMEDRALPAWIKTLEEVLTVADTQHSALLSQPSKLEKPIPFQELFAPFLSVARRKLNAQAGSSYDLLSAQARKALEESLIERLSDISCKVLQYEFSIFRAARQPAWVRLLSQGGGAPPESELYSAFINSLLAGKLLSFFLKYSVLARLLSTALDFWVEATCEFLQRLERDLPLLQRAFQLNPNTKAVLKVYPNLSDFHHRGRSVMALEFDNETKIVYKPKDLGSEEQFYELLEWFNEHGAPLPFKKLRVVNCSGYGWVEYAEQSPCADEAAARRYYARAGMLLCVLYLLQAVDCHCDNLVAAGEHPVLLDCETLMHHRAPLSKHTAFSMAHFLAGGQIDSSVFRIGMLPRWQFSPDGRSAIDVSSLGAVAEQQTSFPVPVWHHVNTDEMELRYQSGTIQPQANVACLKSTNLSPNDYVEHILDGFRQMYECFLKNRSALLAWDSPLQPLYRQKIRIIFRQTDAYHTLLRRTLEPDWLKGGAAFSIQLDHLSRPLLSYPSKSDFWPVLKAETESLEQLDIPHFTAYPNSNRLYLSDRQSIEQCFDGPSSELVIKSLSNLSQVDLEKQLDFIRASFTQREPDQFGATSSASVAAPFAHEPLAPETALMEAQRIASRLQGQAIRAPDGSATWLGFGYLAGARRYQLQPMGFALYDGSCGVALFLSALEHVTGGAGLRDLALAALLPLHDALSDTESAQARLLFRDMSIGGLTGLGSILYTLTRTSQFLREPGLLEDARKLCLLLTPELIRRRHAFDFVEGAAGAILGLLALHRATNDANALTRAIACGDFLIEKRVPSSSGFKAWPDFQGQLLTGFSHGAAGIAYALLRLYESTRDARFFEAAEEAIAYERSVFDAEEKNWPDFRLVDSRSFMTTWCHGAPGIGLGRLGSLTILDTPDVRSEIEVALETTLQSDSNDRDHLCCGSFGTAEALLAGGLQLDRPELVLAARQRASMSLHLARQNGHFRIFYTLPNSLHNPGFFAGTTGIGYEMLRMAFPEMLPSVLRLE
jgi:type 2 lantibiotic biosynthesis protein LanM